MKNKEIIETIEDYLHYEQWRYVEPPIGKEECEIFLKLLKQDNMSIIKNFLEWFFNQKIIGIDYKNRVLLIGKNGIYIDAYEEYKKIKEGGEDVK